MYVFFKLTLLRCRKLPQVLYPNLTSYPSATRLVVGRTSQWVEEEGKTRNLRLEMLDKGRRDEGLTTREEVAELRGLTQTTIGRGRGQS